jgi:glucose-6-phosphate isomerase/transaldolase/glucose-6-phosphate isomerase
MSDLIDRLKAKDTTLWPAGNVAANRLGWVDIAERMLDNATSIKKWAQLISHRHIVLIGMGGSSLGPEVLRAAAESDRLIVLDTTDPATIEAVDADNAFFVVSSKSGGTLEVASLMAYFWEQVPNGDRWAAITDPGTELEKIAKDRGFNRIFTNPADIGGRYSVLSYFGLVPASLLGYDIEELCTQARDIDWDEAVELGSQMAEAALEGRDKVTVVAPAGRFSTFGLWIEQLIAESTGKLGKGCIPVPTTEPETGSDRFIDRVKFQQPTDLGREFFRWEVATAIAGHLLEIDPFNEPNVAESKANTKRVLESLPLSPPKPDAAAGTLAWLKSQAKPGDYISIQAYLPYSYEFELEQLRRRIRDELDGIAVTAGFGPRFLHSTGQLHKGGPNNIIALQLVPNEPTADVPIPGQTYDFATLIGAQSIGDYESLKTHDRRVRRVAVKSPDDVK